MRLAWTLTLILSLFEIKTASAAASMGFVRREGNRLMLEDRSFYFNGANQYYLFYKSKAMTDEVLEDASHMGLKVMRTWAFCDGEWHDGHSLQPEPGVYNDASFQNIDYAIYRAEQLGIRLIFSLVNNWDAFGGMNSYVKWSESAREHDDFYSDQKTRALYKDYVTYVLNRKNTYTGRAYKDEPAILMWELANEPRVARNRVSDLYSWINEMAGHIKSIDPNHLVSTGSEGDIDTDLTATHQSPHIDVVSFHLYPEDWNLSSEKTLSYIERQIRTAKDTLNKPVFCGEFGIRDKSLRDATYRAWYALFQSHAIDGSLFWLLSGQREDGSLYPDYDGFTIYHPESTSTLPIIQSHSSWTQTKSGQVLDTVAPQLSLDRWSNGDRVQGDIQFTGKVSDDRALKSVTVSFGGVPRPTVLEQGTWSYSWNTREVLDGKVEMTLIATDAEDNVTQKTFWLEVDNQAYKQGSWQLTGQSEQDDGYNYIYFLAAQNLTERTEQGHFVARFYLRPEGTLGIGTHYENSQVYQGNPTVSELKQFYGPVRYLEIDMGERTVEPGKYIGFKGQLQQADGGMKTGNDWSASDLPPVLGAVHKVLWLKDGQVIGGSAP